MKLNTIKIKDYLLLGIPMIIGSIMCIWFTIYVFRPLFILFDIISLLKLMAFSIGFSLAVCLLISIIWYLEFFILEKIKKDD